MNIYKILEALKNVEEGEQRVYRIVWQDREGEVGSTKLRASSTLDAEARFKNEADPELDILEIQTSNLLQQPTAAREDADYPFAGKAVGQKPGDQVRGQEAFKTGGKEHPAKGRLVGANESTEMECNDTMSPLEKKLRARWEQTKKGLAEYGMTTGGTAMGGGATTTAPDPAEKAKQVAQVQQNVNKLKSAGANIPNVNQAVQSVMKDPTDPASQQDRNISAGLGQEIDQVLTKGDPSTVNQLASLIKKVKGA